MDNDQHDGEHDELDDTENRVRVPLETYARIEAAPLPPMSPDGGVMPGAGLAPPAPVPAATPDNFVCLRGPCRYYWEIVTHLVSGNPKDTWDVEDGLKDQDGKPLEAPRQISRSCLVHPGGETELTDDVVYRCNRWDPLERSDVKAVEKRRRVYLKTFPQHADKE